MYLQQRQKTSELKSSSAAPSSPSNHSSGDEIPSLQFEDTEDSSENEVIIMDPREDHRPAMDAHWAQQRYDSSAETEIYDNGVLRDDVKLEYGNPIGHQNGGTQEDVLDFTDGVLRLAAITGEGVPELSGLLDEETTERQRNLGNCPKRVPRVYGGL